MHNNSEAGTWKRIAATVVFLIVALCGSSSAFAQAKEYRPASYPSLGWFSSGAAACQADFSYRSTVDPSYTYNFNSYTDSTASAGSCRGTRCAKSNPSNCSSDPNQAWSSTQNRTTVCVAPQVWDQPTQTCITPQPAYTCAGYDSPELAAAAYYPYITNRTVSMDGDTAVVRGTGAAQLPGGAGFIACKGGAPLSPTPSSTPQPPPTVETNYPECPPGSYKFIDIDGSSYCSKMTPDQPTCASGNAGMVNGKYVCLPANPAPATAKTAADNAVQKAKEAAAAGENTPTAAEKAKEAIEEARRAVNAAKSDPNNPATAIDAGRAVAAAKDAARIAGTAGTGGSGTGVGTAGGSELDGGPKECGSPGHPPCKIDETGTPNGEGAFDASKTALDGAYESGTNKLGELIDSSGKDTSWGWIPLSWVMPGSCSPVNLGTFQAINHNINLDICPQLASASPILTFIWVVGTLGLCIRMVFQTIVGGG